MPLPPPEHLAEQADRPGHAHPPDEGHAPGGQRQPARRHLEAGRQLLQPQALPVLGRRLAPQPRVDVLRVHRLLQPRQLPPQVAWPPEAPVEERPLEPAVEVLHRAVELWLPLGDEHRADAEAQAPGWPGRPPGPPATPRTPPPASQGPESPIVPACSSPPGADGWPAGPTARPRR